MNPSPELQLVCQGQSFLGFLSALGALRLAGDLGIRLGWRPDQEKRAFLVGADRATFFEAIKEGLAKAELDETRIRTEAGRRLPWDVCGGGRVQLRSAIPEIIEDLRAHPQKVERALFEAWTWSDEGDPLGWAPTMREHALRAHAPTKDASYRENAALWLAWEGIGLFGRDGDRVDGWYRERGQKRFVWPLWSSPATLPVVRSILRAEPRRPQQMGIRECWMTRPSKTSGKALVLTQPQPWPIRPDDRRANPQRTENSREFRGRKSP